MVLGWLRRLVGRVRLFLSRLSTAPAEASSRIAEEAVDRVVSSIDRRLLEASVERGAARPGELVERAEDRFADLVVDVFLAMSLLTSRLPCNQASALALVEREKRRALLRAAASGALASLAAAYSYQQGVERAKWLPIVLLAWSTVSLLAYARLSRLAGRIRATGVRREWCGRSLLLLLAA